MRKIPGIVRSRGERRVGLAEGPREETDLLAEVAFQGALRVGQLCRRRAGGDLRHVRMGNAVRLDID